MIQIQSWQDAAKLAYSVRHQVFIQEQGVPEALELDEFDADAQHALAMVGAKCIGTARLVILDSDQGQIGRMAVLLPFRKKGVGREILNALIHLAQSRGISRLSLHSQTTAIPFYEKLGFIAQGPIYNEAGIPHRNMILLLTNSD